MEPMSTRSGEGFLCNFVSIELASGDGFVDSREVLEDDSPGAEIQMADFGVAHLTVGKSDIGAAGAEFAARIIAIKLIVKRRAREERGVAIFFCLGFAVRINTPAVANDQQCGASHTRELSRRLPRSTSCSFSCICGKRK